MAVAAALTVSTLLLRLPMPGFGVDIGGGVFRSPEIGNRRRREDFPARFNHGFWETNTQNQKRIRERKRKRENEG